MGVYELSGAGSVKTGRTLYTSMNAGNQFGAMVPIAYFSGSSAQIIFYDIPQTYQDLRLVLNVRTDFAAYTPGLSIYTNDNLTNSGYSQTVLYGDGTSAASIRATTPYGINTISAGASSTAGIYNSITCDILDYKNTTTFKTALTRTAADYNGGGSTLLYASLVQSTSAITRIDVAAQGTFLSGTTVALYGIRAVSS